MVTEVRRQGKHGVNFIKMADSRGGESQMLAKDEISAVVGEAHRRNLRVGHRKRQRSGAFDFHPRHRHLNRATNEKVTRPIHP